MLCTASPSQETPNQSHSLAAESQLVLSIQPAPFVAK
jgi:hypothetical protein